MSREVNWVKAMFGENAAHAPVQLCMQDMGDGIVMAPWRLNETSQTKRRHIHVQ